MKDSITFTQHALDQLRERFPEHAGAPGDLLASAELWKGWKNNTAQLAYQRETYGFDSDPDIFIAGAAAMIVLNQRVVTVLPALRYRTSSHVSVRTTSREARPRSSRYRSKPRTLRDKRNGIPE